ncbi:MAG: membrane dipeptidase, partial [Bacteroidota bacterium]
MRSALFALTLVTAVSSVACGADPSPVDALTPASATPTSGDSARTEASGARGDSMFADSGAIAMDAATVERLVAEDPLWADALRIHYDALVMDGHIDTPTEMLRRGYAFGDRHRPQSGSAHVDLPRMIEGGLDAPIFSIWVSRTLGEGRRATNRARDMIAEVERQLAGLSGVELATTGADIRRIIARGDKAVLLGLEGGHALAGSTDVLRELAASGVRYVTLTHTNSNKLADSSQDEARHGGL